MNLRMDLTPQQVQTFSPLLVESNHILQLAAPEFKQFLLNQLRQNPFLEPLEEAEESTEVEIGEFNANNWKSNSTKPTFLDGLDGVSNLAQKTDLKSLLLQHLGCEKTPSYLHPLALVIIDALDEEGYLRISFADLLSDEDALSPSQCEWESALQIVQHIAPTGVGARDLIECLRLQVQAKSSLSTRDKKELLLIIEHGLLAVAKRDFNLLEKTLKLSAARIEQLISYLQQLDPKPGRQFSVASSLAFIPDVYLYKEDHIWHIEPNFTALPRLKIKSEYTDLLKENTAHLHALFQKEWRHTQWLVKSVEKRHHTICEVAKVILEKQSLFFEYGDQAIQPLLISEVAAQLGLHESTISRATSNKYMSTPNGVFAFNHFFSRSLTTNFGGTCSTRMVKAKIKEYIEHESHDKPLSDVTIHSKLQKDEIQIAKRTVSKYRQQLHIPSAKERMKTPTVMR